MKEQLSKKTNYKDEIKLINNPLQHKINFKVDVNENKNDEKNSQNSVINSNNLFVNINNNNNIKNSNESQKINYDIFPNFPSFFNDNMQAINKKKNKDNQTKLKNNNILKIYKDNCIGQIPENNKNNLLTIKNPFIFKNNNNIYLNDFRQTYNKILFPGISQLSLLLSIKNSFFKPLNTLNNLSDFSNSPPK